MKNFVIAWAYFERVLILFNYETLTDNSKNFERILTVFLLICMKEVFSEFKMEITSKSLMCLEVFRYGHYQNVIIDQLTKFG